MEKRRFKTREYYEAPVCECGGVVCINNGSTMYMSYPPQKDFSCNKCGKPMRLSEPDFPGLRHEVIGLNRISATLIRGQSAKGRNMMTCRECKYWVDDKPDYDKIMHPEDLETGEEMKMPFEVRKCNHPSITLFERNPDPKGVSLCDGSDYRATMYTGPEYGCVNGES